MLVWAIPVALLLPVLFFVRSPVLAVPMLLAGPILPALAVYQGLRRQSAERS
jgi:hypothetical protein